MEITPQVPDWYRVFWTDVKNTFLLVSAGIVLSNLIAAGVMTWAAIRLGGK